MGSPCSSFYFSENLKLFIKCWGKGLLCYFLRTQLLVKLICYKHEIINVTFLSLACHVFFLVFLLLCSHFLQGSFLQNWGSRSLTFRSALEVPPPYFCSLCGHFFRAQFSCRTEGHAPLTFCSGLEVPPLYFCHRICQPTLESFNQLP